MTRIKSSHLKVGDVFLKSVRLKGENVLKRFQVIQEIDEKDVYVNLFNPEDSLTEELTPKKSKRKTPPAKKFDILEANFFTHINPQEYGVMIFSYAKPEENTLYDIYTKDSDVPQKLEIGKVLVSKPNKQSGWLCSIKKKEKT